MNPQELFAVWHLESVLPPMEVRRLRQLSYLIQPHPLVVADPKWETTKFNAVSKKAQIRLNEAWAATDLHYQTKLKKDFNLEDARTMKQAFPDLLWYWQEPGQDPIEVTL